MYMYSIARAHMPHFLIWNYEIIHDDRFAFYSMSTQTIYSFYQFNNCLGLE